MRDYLNIGSSPASEDCAQIGAEGYREKAIEECTRFIAQLRKQFGNEPTGARLSIKWFQHDFGSYCEVVCYYDEELGDSLDYAFKCEGEAWDKWQSTDLSPIS